MAQTRQNERKSQPDFLVNIILLIGRFAQKKSGLFVFFLWKDPLVFFRPSP